MPMMPPHTRPLIRATPPRATAGRETLPVTDVLQRQRPHYHGDGLVAGVAADPGDDGHPGPPAPPAGRWCARTGRSPAMPRRRCRRLMASQAQRVLTALETGANTAFFLADPPSGAGRCRSLHRPGPPPGDGEPSHQLAPGIHHGGGDQVVPLEVRAAASSLSSGSKVTGSSPSRRSPGFPGFVQQHGGEGSSPAAGCADR